MGFIMLIKDIFEKEVTRDYDSVIFVDDDTSEKDLFIELDEFIVTEELLAHFNEFFTNFIDVVSNSKKYTGVWISGFFGSGKSHFLKILSYLLANDFKVQDKKPLDFFIKDKKISDSKIIKKMEDSSNFNNDVALFNVSYKNIDGKLLTIFYNLFNEKQGYCGTDISVAYFEKELVYRNNYNQFKNQFKINTGKNWDDEREHFSVYRDDIVQALNDIEFMSDEAINEFIKNLKSNCSITIDKFAQEVNEYCDKQNKNLIFLADEMGQFISGNSDLMLELQSIVEKLSNACKGKAWVIVTSQHKISDTFVDDNINDFSKIKGRFKTQLNLTSSNVDEVIKLRFLEKNDNAKKELLKDYDKFSASLNNNILFEDSSDMESYNNQDEYLDYYPFIPYQFNLVQQSIIGITDNIPDDSSIPFGERSMITCFKEAAVKIENQKNDYIAPFYIFFESIKQFIDPLDLNNINNARKNKKLNSFDINVLKALFLIKFLNSSYLKPSLNNISTLMISNIDEDINNLRINVNDSLNKLINQAFVHKNGDMYSYLTKKEQEIDSIIKNQKIEIKDIKTSFIKYIKGIYTNKLYKLDNLHSYNKLIKIDTIDENKKDLTLNIITNYFDYGVSDLNQSTLSDVNIHDNQLKKLSENKNEIFIKLYSDDLIFSEIKDKLKIQKYLNDKKSISDRDIECEKQKEVNEIDLRIKKLINDSIVQANIYISGQKTEFKENNVKDIFDNSFDILFSNVYYNKHFMNGINPSNEDIYNILKAKSQTTLVDSETKGINALNDMETFINQIGSEKIKDIFLRYKRAPYGFIDMEISWIIANLFSQKRISLVLDYSELFIEDNNSDKLAEYIMLKDSIISNKLYLQKRKRIDPKWVKSAKNIYKELSAEKIDFTDENLMIKFKNVLNNKIDEINDYLDEIRGFQRFPGKDKFLKAKDLFNQCVTKEILFEFFKFVFENKKEFNNVLEDFNKVSSFYNDNQKDIFKKSCKIADEHDDNKISLNNEELDCIVDKINKIIVIEEPYSDIQKLKRLNEGYETKFNELLNKKQNSVCNEINNDLNGLIKLLDNDILIKNFKVDIENDFNNLKYKVNNRRKIHEIMGFADDSSKLKENYLIEINNFIDSPHVMESTIYIEDILNKEIDIKDNEDLNELLDKIRVKIIKELEDNDVVKIRDRGI